MYANMRKRYVQPVAPVPVCIRPVSYTHLDVYKRQVLTILAASLIVPALPYLLSFAAGAMLYVVVEELIPEMSQGTHSNIGTVCFALGFSVMMVLDVALG